jgi:hypothetical protein
VVAAVVAAAGALFRRRESALVGMTAPATLPWLGSNSRA